MRRADLPWIALLAAWGAWLLLPGLAHPSLWNWDESIHQAVARGVYDSFFTPHVYPNHLYPEPTGWDYWVNGGVWLHKPPLPFWLGAIVMHAIGVTPLALRLVSAAGMIGASICLFLLLRSATARPWAALVAAAFLALPFGWKMVQGYQFGDVTDCTVTGFTLLSTLLLLLAVERDSTPLAAGAGAACGLAFLCKSALALTPMGVAAALWILGAAGFCKGPRTRSLAALLAAFVVIAVPWEIACAIRWPELNHREVVHTFGHLTGHTVENWVRPWDGIFNEIDQAELSPLPLALPLVAGLWLILRALRRRESVVLIAALWLWAEWIVLTAARVKVPAVAWTAVPAVFFALGVAVADAFGRPALAAALAGAFLGPSLAAHWPSLARLRLGLPRFFVETRDRPGLVEGLAVAAAALALGLVILALRRVLPLLGRALGGLLAVGAAGLAAWALFVQVPRAQAAARDEMETQSLSGYGREAGLAIGRASPEKSVIFLGVDRDPPSSFGVQELIFWSGRAVYRRAPDLSTARRAGWHSYLVTPVAQNLAEVPGVPAASWLRAYDLDAPAVPAALPPDLTPLRVREGDMTVLGYAAAPGDGRRGRYAFFVHAGGAPQRLAVRFHTRHGDENGFLDPAMSLTRIPPGAPWFVLPALGPPPDALVSIDLPGAQPVAVLGTVR